MEYRISNPDKLMMLTVRIRVLRHNQAIRNLQKYSNG